MTENNLTKTTMTENNPPDEATAADDFADAARNADAQNDETGGELQTHRFRFDGDGGEFFRIWLANVLLTILTVGVFSAWAKVRVKRYFYGNTFLDGANFEYHARPLSILLARVALLLFIVAGAVWAGEEIAKNAAYSTVLFLVLPWAVVRGLAFNARNSSYRNVRFSFNKNYKTMYLLALPLIVALLAPTHYAYFSDADIQESPTKLALIGLSPWLVFLFLYPQLIRLFHRYKICEHRWGASPFAFNTPGFAKYAAIIFGFLFLGIAVIVLTAFFLGVLFSGLPDARDWAGILGVVAGYFAFIFIIAAIRANLFVLFWNNIRLNGGEIRCDVPITDFVFKIQFVNFLAILFSLGLLHPWAQVRRARFLAKHIFVVVAPGSLDNIARAGTQKEGAFGEELDASQGFDFDIALI